MKPRISDKEFDSRIKKTQRKMEEQELDFLIAFSSYPEREGHLEYFTNYHGAFPPSQHDDVYRGLGYGALVLERSGGPFLFPGVLFASGRLVGVEKVISNEDVGLAVSDYILEEIRTSGKSNSNVGLVGSDVFPDLYMEQLKKRTIEMASKNANFLESDDLVLEQRMIKSDEEKLVLKEGARIADVGIKAAFEVSRVGAKESDLGIAAAKACYEEGADYVARTRIYGRGISGVRWPIMTNRRLERGEITGIDLVGFYGSYGFDVLRMWAVGNPASKQKQVLGDAAQLTEETTKRLRVGMTGDEISRMTICISKELDLKGTPSPFGHAIGLEIVENPILLPKSNVKTVANSFLCIEPGLESRDGQTIHFEDEVLLNEKGRAETVSKCTKDFS
jgi:Xaa-Pro aminopeptidase